MKLTMKDAETVFRRWLIVNAIRDNKGSVAKAAIQLDINRCNMYRLMKRLGLTRRGCLKPKTAEAQSAQFEAIMEEAP
jgi:transcriptional regulator with GAF, ATPase, and Fis domain